MTARIAIIAGAITLTLATPDGLLNGADLLGYLLISFGAHRTIMKGRNA